jgi:hypothetical protein
VFNDSKTYGEWQMQDYEANSFILTDSSTGVEGPVVEHR